MLYVFALVLGIGFGLLTGGRLEHLARMRFRWPWLIIAAIVVRELILATPLNTVEGTQYIYLLALLAIVAWTNWHWRRIRGMWVVSLGAALNVLVIAANGARMPVASEASPALVRQGTIGQYTLMGPHTNLNLLGDWIRLLPLRAAYSIGDVLIAIGLAIVVFLAVRKPPNKELTPP